MKTITLSNSIPIPPIGYGTYKLPDSPEGAAAVAEAISLDYRLIDGAAAYGNEKAVGEGIKKSETDRSQIFVTSKLPNTERSFDAALRAFDRSLRDLNLDYLDLYLIHWPFDRACYPDWEKQNIDTWRALERIYSERRVRAIGVSNFFPEHLDVLLREAETLPMVNQIEFNPGMQQRECVDLCNRNNIRIEAWSPLARGRIFDNPLLLEIADRHKRSIAQICLRWEIQCGAIPIPKSANPYRMKENLDIFSFTLSDEEIAAIDSLPQFGNSGLNPANIDHHFSPTC